MGREEKDSGFQPLSFCVLGGTPAPVFLVGAVKDGPLRGGGGKPFDRPGQNTDLGHRRAVRLGSRALQLCRGLALGGVKAPQIEQQRRKQSGGDGQEG